MSKFVITTDSCSDLSLEQIKKLGVTSNIDIINMTVNVSGQEYNGTSRSITPKDLYKLMRQGVVPYTSQVNPASAKSFFEKHLKKGVDIIHICLSSQLSGTYNSCKVAENDLKKMFPERKIAIIDSLSGSLGQGLLVLEAMFQKNLKKSFEQIVKFVDEQKHKICHLFIVDDLCHLKRGGRISKTEATIGSILGIKPILTADNRGKIGIVTKIRGRKAAINFMIEKLKENIDLKVNDTLAIGHGDCEEDAKLMKNMILEKLNIKNIIIDNIGPVMGSHAGPGVLAIFFKAHHRLATQS